MDPKNGDAITIAMAMQLSRRRVRANGAGNYERKRRRPYNRITGEIITTKGRLALKKEFDLGERLAGALTKLRVPSLLGAVILRYDRRRSALKSAARSRRVGGPPTRSKKVGK